MNNRQLRVFLCHSSNDKPAVRELYKKLRAETWIQAWLDEEELYPGQDWNLEIEKTIEDTDVIIVCLSKNSTTKEGYVQREIRIALDYADYKPEGTLFIIPVRLEECTPPKRLGRWQYEDFFDEKRERAVQRLLVSLKRRADSLGLKYETAFSKTVDRVSTPPPSISSDESSQAKSLTYETPKPAKVITPPNKLTLSNGMEFMRVPAGKFLMGSEKYDSEKPQHTVDIPYDYWMARFPVTNEQYNLYVKAKGIKHPVSDWEKKKDYPIVSISWKDANEYCQWLNQMQNAELKIQDLEIRLPSEAEWEKAARGTDGREYPWGNTLDKNKYNSRESKIDSMSSVGNFSPQGDSPYGCADMSGNVWEWTHSEYKAYPYNAKDGREGETKSVARVLRGGAFNSVGSLLRCAFRLGDLPDLGYFNVGFRVVARVVMSPFFYP